MTEEIKKIVTTRKIIGYVEECFEPIRVQI